MEDIRIGLALRAVRVRKRLRQSDVALLAGVSRKTVGTVERGALDQVRMDALRSIAAERGWEPATVSTWVIFGESPTNRRHVTAHEVLLRGRFPARGAAMRAWLARPAGPTHGLSFFSDAPRANRTGGTVTPRRVRPHAGERGRA